MKPTLSYCGQEVYAHDYDRFLLSLFIPADQREAFFALYAINAELARIRGLVSEEMVGHVRYAWWQETIEGLYEGLGARGQPLLEALAPVLAAGHMPRERLLPLVEQYRGHFPGAPPDIDPMLEELSIALIRELCPPSEAAWKKAKAIIDRHRLLHGRRRNGWLNIRLLLSGML